MYLKSYFQLNIFLKLKKKKWLKSVFFLGGGRWYYQKIKQNSHLKDQWGKKCYLLLLSKNFDLLKKENISNFNEISFKKRGKLILKHCFLLHLMCYIAHQWFIQTTRNLCLRIFFYIAPRRSQKISIIFFTFVTGMKHTSWSLLRPWFN